MGSRSREVTFSPTIRWWELSIIVARPFTASNDGIDAYGIAGNTSDNTGYGGPNAYFSNIDPTQSVGNVNFITPIPPGGTGYFSLAAALSSYTSCSNAINYAVSVSLDSSGQNITGLFTPNSGFTLTSAAQACGFSNFNWQQLITNIPSPSPYYDANFNALSAPAPLTILRKSAIRRPVRNPFRTLLVIRSTTIFPAILTICR